MKAAVINAVGKRFCIEDIEIDSPKGREVKVRVKASGLCHSDLHVAENDFGFPLPAVFGHELAGIVTEIGPDVREFAAGDHVVGSLIQFCGHCQACMNGRTYQCQNPGANIRGPEESPRLSKDGQPVTAALGISAFAEYTLVHENQLVKVPKELPFPQACLLGCATITGAGAAINKAKVKPGDSAVVIGIGGVGLNVISGARLAGARRIIAIDMQPTKEALARKFGATDFICPAGGNPVETVRELTSGGVDHVFEVIGLKATSEQAIKMARPGGSVYLIGMHMPGSTIAVEAFGDLVLNQVTLMGVLMGSANIKHDIPMYADLYLQGRFNLDDLISKEINLSEINEAYQDMKDGMLARSVITSF